MTNFDSLKAFGAAIAEAMKDRKPPKVGELCQCGRPYEAIEVSSDQPAIVTCPHCDRQAMEEDR